MAGDEKDFNKYPNDAAEIAALVRQGDAMNAVLLLQIWGSKQRDIGGLRVLEQLLKQTPMTAEMAEDLSKRAT